MSRDLIQFAFAAGELSPKLVGRADYEKYDLGLAYAKNWFVDYRGGLTTRPGQHFIDYLKNPNSATKFVKFQYSPDIENTYVIAFGDGYIRFLQDGAYLLEANVTITGITAATPPVVTAAAHGFAAGDWIKISGVVGMTELNNRTFEVGTVTTDTFELIDVTDGASLVTAAYTAYTSGGTAARIYTITNPYLAVDLAKLKAYQIRDYVRLTHPDYPVKNLVRSADTSWAISNEVIGNENERPGTLSLTASASGSAGVGFAVTAIDNEGMESLPSNILLTSSIVNYTSTAGFVTLRWNPVVGAAYYKIYRTLVLTDGTAINGAMQLGYVGRSNSAVFVDNNITPDYTVAPPQYYNPFANGAVLNIDITATGSGYSSVPAVAVSGGSGAGFEGYAVVSNNTVVGVVIIHAGENYESPVVSITGGGGSGATATATVRGLTGNNPSASALFQQRQIYAATENYPLAVFGSRAGQLSNMDVSLIQSDDDAYEVELDASTVAPIRHLIVMRGGLLLFSQAGIWQLTGGSAGVITPTNALAEPQTFRGCSDVPPIFIDTDLLYITEKDATVRLLGYNDYSKLYGGEDMSILSSHFFSPHNRIVRWTYEETPFRLVFAVREDGTMICMTIDKEQKMFAWTRFATQGYYKDALTIEQDGDEVTYLAVRRKIDGNWVLMIETFGDREITNVEDAVCMDSALTLGSTTPNRTLTLGTPDANDVVVITASSALFSAGDVGSIIRHGNDKFLIVTYTSTTVVSAEVLRGITELIPETETAMPLEYPNWTLDAPVSAISGLWHLEGASVSVLADGSVVAGLTVSGGTLTLPTAATRVAIGLGFTCKAQTLSPTAPDSIIEGHKKNIKGVAVRINEGRGLAIGIEEETVYDMRDRTTERLGEPIALRNDISYVAVDAGWEEEAQLWFVQAYPLPCSILGFVTDLEVGDDNA